MLKTPEVWFWVPGSTKYQFYRSAAQAARDNYIHKQTIYHVLNGELKTAAGYKWRKESY